jgi:hypothetical protein
MGKHNALSRKRLNRKVVLTLKIGDNKMSYMKEQFNEYLEDDFSDDDFRFYVEMKQQQMDEDREYIREMLCNFNIEENE